MKEYEHAIELPKIGETFTTHDSTYTVIASKPEKMLLIRYNVSEISPLTYVVALWPEATEGPMGERDFHWGQGHYYDVFRCDGSEPLADAVADFGLRRAE